MCSNKKIVNKDFFFQFKWNDLKLNLSEHQSLVKQLFARWSSTFRAPPRWGHAPHTPGKSQMSEPEKIEKIWRQRKLRLKKDGNKNGLSENIKSEMEKKFDKKYEKI